MGTINHPVVGSVSYTVNKDGSLNLQPGWQSQNIGIAVIPELAGVPTYGGNRFSGKVSFYRRAIPQLRAAFAELGRLGLDKKIIFWDGSFNPRLMRGGSSPSNHSFGTALDVNADWNPFRKQPAAPGAKGDLHAIAQVFKRYGFSWGGDWKNADGMHFEINRILSEAEIVAAARGTQAIPVMPQIPVPNYNGPGFEVVVNNTGNNIGPGLIWNNELYVSARSVLNQVGQDIIQSGDQRARREQPRFYIVTGAKKS